MNPDMTARGKRTTLWIPGSRSRDRYGGPPYPDPGRLIRPTTWIPRRRDAVPIFKPSYPCGGMDTGTGGWTWRPRSAIPDHLPDDRRLGRARPEHPGRCRFSSVSTELRASSPPSRGIRDLQAEASLLPPRERGSAARPPGIDWGTGLAVLREARSPRRSPCSMTVWGTPVSRVP
jgi:hypothetical protein